MDTRSWLWRLNSSNKSPGETESSGGSMSSHSDDQIYSNQSSESPEVTSKAEEQNVEDGVKILSRQLSEALLKISIKEDLVKEHCKVAEEAVEGLDKAEKEVLALRRQVDVLTLRNSTLQDRVCHLDGALKECLRQLRQTRDEKDEKIDEALRKKTSEWQATKTGLEKQLSDLHLQLQYAKKPETLLAAIERIEKENSALKLELASMAEELEMRFIERELSKQAAEEASKLHLESVKKAAKFEAECCRLNAALKKALVTNAQKSSTDSHSNVESDTFKETNKLESNRKSPSRDVNLMEDFLEMERLVALPKSAPIDSSRNQILEVEEALKRVDMEKGKMEITLNERENELKEAETKLVKMEALLINANDAKETTEKELESVKATVIVLQESIERSKLELQSQLDIECNERKEAESRLQDAYTKKSKAESRLNALDDELESLIQKVYSLESEVEKELALSGKLGAKCQELEAELESLIPKVDSLETEVGKEQTLSGKLGARCRELEAELESLILKIDFLETEVERERSLSKKWGVKCQELEGEISRLQRENQYLKPANILNAEDRTNQETELAMAGCKFADCQKTIVSLSNQLKTLATFEDFLIDTNEFSRRI